MAAKRAQKAVEEARENIQSETLRRKAGRVSAITRRLPSLLPFHQIFCCTSKKLNSICEDASKIKDELLAKQLAKDMEEKKRGAIL